MCQIFIFSLKINNIFFAFKLTSYYTALSIIACYDLKTEEKLKTHILRTCSCGKKFLVSKHIIKTDFFSQKDKTILTLLPLFCKSYFCDNCSRVKVSKYKKIVKNNLNNEAWRFLTLTTINNGASDTQKLFEINRDWNRLRTYLVKRYGKISYCKVIERGKNGMIHLHVILNHYISWFIIMRQWKKYCGAYIVNISRVKSHSDVVRYVFKYMTKSVANFESNEMFYLNSKRRIGFSRDFKFDHKKDGEWSLFTRTILREKNIIPFMLEIIIDGELILDDFDYSNLSPPLLTYFKEDFPEILKGIYESASAIPNPMPKKQIGHVDLYNRCKVYAY